MAIGITDRNEITIASFKHLLVCTKDANRGKLQISISIKESSG
jgi:hypothetical protein